jgi:LuxR family maltose regulon positive regulatory protein
MSVSTLVTKLYIPSSRPDLVARPRLIDRLNEGLRGKLTLISAPAGFGKTSLLSAWSEQTTLPVAWLSLDEYDDDPNRFWQYVVAALQTACLEPAKAAAHLGATAQKILQSDRQTAIEPLLVSLVNDIAAHGEPLLLVLDDLHTITDPAIFAGLDFFLDHQPPNLHLVIITREDPPLPLSRLRVRGQLCEIRAAGLRFLEEETAVFLNDLRLLNCDDEAITALNRRTEGWVAGLQLAALALQSPAANGSTSEFIAAFSGSDRFITDYLVDEVLSRQETAVRQFLRRTSILSRFTADLCDAVMDAAQSPISNLQSPISQSRSILNYLERANLFLVPLDNERRWYRYHHLFAEFLRQRLLEQEPALLPTLRLAAARWLADSDRPREALPYALAAPDFSLAADLIETLAPQVLEQENAAIVQAWIGQLPETLLAERPFLNIYYAWALAVTGAAGNIDEYLATAVTLSEEAAPADRQLITGMAAAHHAYAAMFAGAHEEAGQLAQQALAALPETHLALRARTAAVLGNSYNYTGRQDAAIHAYRDAIGWCETIGDVANATLSLCSLAEIYFDRTQLSLTTQTYQEALDFAQRHTGSSDNPFTGFAHFAVGRVARERNELDTALAQMQHGAALCREWRQAYSLVIGLMDLGILHTMRGEWAQARQMLQEARPLAQTASPEWGGGMVDALLARLALAQGDVDAAARWAAGCGFAPDDAPSYELTLVNFTLARTLIAQNHFEEALALLTNLAALHEPIGRLRLVMEARVWQAAAYAAQGNAEQAAAQLQAALCLAEPEGYVRVFVDAGPAIADLLAQQPPSPFQQKLLAAFGVESDPTPLPKPAQSALLDPLNERELTVLRLMAAGLSNRDIGDELYLSVNTIRWYASQIYSKMGVSGRGTAVAQARELGIL